MLYNITDELFKGGNRNFNIFIVGISLLLGFFLYHLRHFYFRTIADKFWRCDRAKFFDGECDI